MKKFLIIFLGTILLISFTACNPNTSGDTNPSTKAGQEEDSKQDTNSEVGKEKSDEKPASPKDTTEENGNNEVVVYFGDDQGMALNGEKRIIDDLSPRTLVEELIKGPQDPENSPSIPEGTSLLDAYIEDGTAYVDFSREFVDNHWGGSSGERITLYSLVNTLALNPGLDVKTVQILVEGETIETLSGHIEIYFPLEPDPSFSKLQ